jgi:acyl carrier protein
VTGVAVANHLGYNMHDELELKIKRIMSKSFLVPLEKITDDALLLEDLGADSLGVFEMVINLEDEFGIEFEDKEMLKLRTVGDAILVLKPLLEKS